MAITQSRPDLDLSTETRSGRSEGRRRFVAFLLSLLLPPALVYLATFALIMVPAFSYERWGLSQWGPVLEFSFQARQENADVLIFGDSSAFLGIDPRLIDAQLGIKSVVLPNTVGSLPVTGEMSLRRYLSQNKPPRLLVLYFSPWNLDYEHTIGDRFLFEGEEMLLHNGSLGEIAAFARRKPLDLLAFPLRLHSTIGPHILGVVLHHPDRQALTAKAQGHVDYTEPHPPLTAPCHLPNAFLAEQSDASIQALMRKYATAQTRVIVYLAPIPQCVNAPMLLTHDFGHLGAAAPFTLPAASFSSDGFYAHIEPSAVNTASELLIQALRRDVNLAGGGA